MLVWDGNEGDARPVGGVEGNERVADGGKGGIGGIIGSSIES